MKKIQKLLLLGCLLAAPVVHAKEEKTGTANDPWKLTGSFYTTTFYDLTYYETASFFTPSSIPFEEKETKKQRISFDIGVLGLGLEKKYLLGAHTAKFVLQTTLNAKNGFGLKRIYVDYNCLTVGLTTTNFCHVAAFPGTLTGDAPCSAACGNVVQIGWKQSLGGALRYVVAVEKAMQPELYPGIEDAARNKKALIPDKELPAVTANLQYKKSFGHIQLGGLFRLFDYHEKGSSDKKYVPTGGVNFSTVLKAIPDLTTVKLYGLYGMGIGSYILDFMCAQKVKCEDFYFENASDKTPKCVHSWGGFVGIEHRWLPKVRSTVAYGYIDSTNDTKRDNRAFKQGHYISGNLTYHPTDHVTLGLEYLYGKRTLIVDKDNHKDAHRIKAAVVFTL